MPSCSALRFAGYSRPALRLVVAGDPAGPAVSNRLEENLIRTTEVLSLTRLDFQRQSRSGATERQGEAGKSEPALPPTPTPTPTPTPAQAARRRDPSVASPEERAVQMAVLTAAMRQQGFSERSIARVQQRAQRLMTAFEAEGVTVPRPRVFDPDAPSTRSRRTSAAPERVPTREVERGPSEPAPPSL
jgi:hypothetical protein